MAAPSPTTRSTPAGRMLENGYQSLITFADDPDVALWETEVTPPGIDGGQKIDVTTMHNTTWRTAAPQALSEITDNQFTCGYDPMVYNQILALRNVRTTITILFPNGDTLAYYGYLMKFEPSSLKNGEFPTANVTIVATNRDSSGTEQSPVLTTAAGTGT